jgi:hypothetical protein
MVLQTDGGTIGRLGTGVGGKPVTMSEYNHPFPNIYQSEGPFFLTSYGLFQDIDGLMFFDYNGSTDWWTDYISSYFEMNRNTVQMALMPSLASAFRNGLISPALQMVNLQFAADEVLLAPKYDNGGYAGSFPIASTLSLVHGVRTQSFASPSSNIAPFKTAQIPPFVSDTKELVWNPSVGTFAVGSPRFAAATGLFPTSGQVAAGDLRVLSCTDHATITWVPLDSLALQASRRSLFTIVTRTQNTGMVWDGTNTIHNNWGTAPTLMKPAVAVVRLHVRADSIRVVPLTTVGGETTVPFMLAPVDTNTFEVTINQTLYPSPWFGISAFGRGTVTGISSAASIPQTIRLLPNYPNPFNPTTRIAYEIPSGAGSGLQAAGSGKTAGSGLQVAGSGTTAGSGWSLVGSRVRLTVYDVLGREVAMLVDGAQEPGRHEVVFDASGFASGVYIARLDVSTSGKTATLFQRMVLIR